jgi:hypothetical protein
MGDAVNGMGRESWKGFQVSQPPEARQMTGAEAQGEGGGARRKQVWRHPDAKPAFSQTVALIDSMEWLVTTLMSRPCESFVVTELAIRTVGNMSGAAKKVNPEFHC